MDTDMEVEETREVTAKENVMDFESEEGELSDDDADTDIQAKIQPDTSLADLSKRPDIPEIRVFCPLESDMKIQNRAGGFITGIDVFGKEEQARLVDRAKRFGLDSSQANLITEHSLKKLYRSVGVKEGDEKHFHFDSLQMHGTEAMSTQDVFEYFKDYAPTSIEWIDDESCNVVWLDNLSAIRALMGISKPIKNLDKLRKEEKKVGKLAPVANVEKPKGDKSDADSDVIMIEDDNEGSSKLELKQIEEELAADPDSIDASELGLSIPPGRWRKGNTHPNSDGILLRFCPKDSRGKDSGRQRLPQPVFGMMGLVSKSCKQRIKEGLLVRPKIFHDDMGDDRDFIISSDEEEKGKNPWGTLAKSWSNIDRSRRPPPPPHDDGFFGPPLPPGPPPILRLPPPLPLPPNSILNRVGIRAIPEKRSARGRFSKRRSRSKSQSRSSSPSPVIVKPRSSIHARLYGKRRRRSEQDSEDSAFSGSESEGDPKWNRKSKIPRMRMYADEEEVKMKERTKLQARRRLVSDQLHQRSSDSTSRGIDLRDRLRRERAKHETLWRESSISDRSRREHSNRVVRSERVKSHSHPKPTVKSVASSVWSRLSADGTVKIKKEKDEHTESSVSDSEESETSSSGEENLRITRTMRPNESDTVESSSQSESEAEESDNYSSSEEANDTVSKSGGIKSRLGSKLASKNGKSREAESSVSKPRSPLRIEIDNDEYYRSHCQEGS